MIRPHGHLMLAAAALAVAACGLSRPPVERSSFFLGVPREAAAAPTPKSVALRVRPLRAEPLFERKELVYRVDGERVISDFYNEFAERPDSMITSALIGWLKNAKLFAVVVEPGVPAEAPYALDGSVVALYGDLREGQKPAAVMALQFYVVRTANPGLEIVFDRVFRQRVEVSARTPAALVQGYNEALARIFAELERELTALNLPP
jgi:cholesterol transport system auxiliary component